MTNSLYYNTVTPLLLSVLKTLMAAKEFEPFRLVGGTALSLHRGHRESVDIDLFTDAEYDSIDFGAIETYLRVTYPYVDTSNDNIIGFGKSYFVGEGKDSCIKLDIFYTDQFIDPPIKVDGIRLASIGEIIAMKLDVINRGGRKKDFWDIHELMDDYSIDQMFLLHEKRSPYVHDRIILKNNFTQFENADEDFDPVCLKEKYWELIKMDITDFMSKLS
jgi:Nucleotidyl transferase AbiEii toxin, Type IV TA system